MNSAAAIRAPNPYSILLVEEAAAAALLAVAFAVLPAILPRVEHFNQSKIIPLVEQW
jgi:hypothetical protein